MSDKPSFRSPPLIGVFAVLVFLVVLLSREASLKEDLPVFLVAESGIAFIELEGEGVQAGVYQLNDGITLQGVIKMTVYPPTPVVAADEGSWGLPVQNGEHLELRRKDHGIAIVQRGWMSASHRMALAIPLHPDRMSLLDWQSLPGISETLAERIEADRHKNGDFLNLEALLRVKGIGRKRIESWKTFFIEA